MIKKAFPYSYRGISGLAYYISIDDRFQENWNRYVPIQAMLSNDFAFLFINVYSVT